MFLESVHMENYRCLKNVVVDFNKTTIFIGENNSGKTSCLDAIKNVLSKVSANATFDEYDYFLEDNNSNPQDSDGLTIKFIFSETYENEWEDDIISKFVSIIQPVFDVRINATINKIVLRVVSKYNKVTEQFENSYNFLNNDGEELPPKSLSLLPSFLKLNPVFYLQALRDSNDVFTGRSFMWGKFLKQVRIKKDDLNEIQKSVSSINSDIISKDPSLNALVKSMSNIEKVLDFDSDSSVSVNAIPIKSWDLLSKAQVVLKNKENLSFPLERYGQGTQSMSIILLYAAYVKILLKQVYDKYSQAIFTLEEPEAHLHPQAVRALEKQLREIEEQKIITTHSPYYVQNVDIYDIRVFRKNDGQTVVRSIPKRILLNLDSIPDCIKKIVENNKDTLEIVGSVIVAKKTVADGLARSLIGYYEKKETHVLPQVKGFVNSSRDLFSEEELNQLNTFVKQNRGELFFARGWLMGEGQSEAVLLPYFAKVLDCDLDENGISFIEYRSNGSAKAFVKLARILDFKWVLLADNDSQGQQSLKEIKENGYSDDDIEQLTRLTKYADIESDLVNAGFLSDYEAILAKEIPEEIINLKEVNIEEYKKKIVELIQSGKGKVRNSYRLIAHLQKRNMAKDEVPENIRYLIERLCGKQ